MFFGGIFIDGQTLQEAGIKYPIKLEYYKNINEDEIIKREKEIYGLNIIKTEYRDGETKVEEKRINHITDDERKIDKILNLFKEHSVTPIHAEYILEDLLRQKF